MRAARTEYTVAGWGSGELWIDGAGDTVLAHEFAFDARAVGEGGDAPARAGARGNGPAGAAAPVGPRPPKGAHGPPSGTVPRDFVRVGHDFAPTSQRARQAGNGGAPAPRDSRAGGLPTAAVHADLDPDALVERFVAFFAGEDPGLEDVPIDLGWATPFQRAVALTLRAVPRGEVVSYGELAALAGYQGAARAAGAFCAGNRFMVIVPCHRVVGATGLGGYGSAGLGVKRRLLELEGVHL